jgi:hypothetical protein
MSLGGLSIAPVAKDGLKRALDGSPPNGLGSSPSSTCTDSLLAEVIERLNAAARIPLLARNSEILCEQELSGHKSPPALATRSVAGWSKDL